MFPYLGTVRLMADMKKSWCKIDNEFLLIVFLVRGPFFNEAQQVFLL